MSYAARLERHRADIARFTARERQISIARLIAIAAAIVAGYFWGWLMLVPVIAFVALVIAHEPAIAAKRRATAAAAFCERGIARMSNAWRGRGDRGAEFADDHHPFSGDLDLFGEGSLFELVSIATTSAGRRILAELFQSPRGDVRERQQAVDELRDRLDLREELAVLAAEVRGGIE
ncbi:MAG TPA: DNA mismatch repair protein MutS, partial [Thermoanaerobaculia bacterium]|nr:DNA mismatch repair protein MutS [Thermoanaerobaculia bacterium]